MGVEHALDDLSVAMLKDAAGEDGACFGLQGLRFGQKAVFLQKEHPHGLRGIMWRDLDALLGGEFHVRLDREGLHRRQQPRESPRVLHPAHTRHATLRAEADLRVKMPQRRVLLHDDFTQPPNVPPIAHGAAISIRDPRFASGIRDSLRGRHGATGVQQRACLRIDLAHRGRCGRFRDGIAIRHRRHETVRIEREVGQHVRHLGTCAQGRHARRDAKVLKFVLFESTLLRSKARRVCCHVGTPPRRCCHESAAGECYVAASVKA